ANPLNRVAQANVAVDAGERESKTVQGDKATITFTVAISKDHDRAATDVVVAKDGRNVLRQKSDVMLLGAGKSR
ncbi:MAG: hypothetical protein M3Q69_11505, partial [Acidobacteriota bacterium]|nr:hypothetical protein [Acidobacteriota bacterium]